MSLIPNGLALSKPAQVLAKVKGEDPIDSERLQSLGECRRVLLQIVLSEHHLSKDLAPIFE